MEILEYQIKDRLTGTARQRRPLTRVQEMLSACTEEAQSRNEMYLAFLDRLQQEEVTAKEDRRVKTSLKIAGLPFDKTIEEYDFAFHETLDKRSVMSLFGLDFIARIGYGILKSASDVLVDTICIDTFEVEGVVMSIDGVKGCHDIRTRGSAHDVFVDLHILVAPNIPLEEAHDITDRVEQAIKGRFPAVTDIVVHSEPAGKG